VKCEVCESKVEHNFLQKEVPVIFVVTGNINLICEHFSAKFIIIKIISLTNFNAQFSIH
jgi:hypothetical protein